MVLGTKKYNREIEALRAAAAGEVGLHPLRLAQLKLQLLQELDSPEAAARGARRLLVEVRTRHTSLLFRYVLPTVIGVSVVGGTVFASGGALPGSPLYPVKRLKEKVELGLTVTAKGRAEVRAEQAQERLSELEQVQAAVVTEDAAVPQSPAVVVPPVPAEQAKAPRNPRAEEARSEAQVEVESALDNLAQVRASLKARGKVSEAGELGRTIKHLTAEALKHKLEVRFTDSEDVDVTSGSTSTSDSTTSGFPGRGKHGGEAGEQGSSTATTSGNTSPGTVAAISSGIYGQVTIGPTCPVVRVGEDEGSCADKPYPATLVVKSQDGSNVVAEVRSGSDGQFKLDLAPGEYLVVPLLSPGHLLPSTQPQPVTVTADTYTKVDIGYDTGIR